jgi:hypothetical protein
MAGQTQRMAPRPKNGGDLLVYIDVEDGTPRTTVMNEKKTVLDLQQEFGIDATVFLSNKNLHDLPRHVRGGVIWLPAKKIVGAVLKSIGIRAYVTVLYPISQRNQVEFVEDMTKVEGYYLQQVLGINALPMNRELRSRDGDVTLVDRNGS